MSAIKKLSRKLVKGKQAKKLVTSEMMVLKMLGNATSRFVIYSEYAMVDLDYFYFSLPLCVARRDSAEDFSRLNALLFTAMAWIFIPAYCFAIP